MLCFYNKQSGNLNYLEVCEEPIKAQRVCYLNVAKNEKKN